MRSGGSKFVPTITKRYGSPETLEAHRAYNRQWMREKRAREREQMGVIPPPRRRPYQKRAAAPSAPASKLLQAKPRVAWDPERGCMVLDPP